jgi:hypothetical protein
MTTPAIAAPAGATEVANWAHVFSFDELHRLFWGAQHGMGA